MTRQLGKQGQFVLHRALALMILFAPAACEKSSPGGKRDAFIPADGAATPTDTAVSFDSNPGTIMETGAGSVDTATTPPMTCASIRNCITACKEDSACKQRCPSMAPTKERSAVTAIETCSRAKCPDGDEPCRCETECLAGGECTEMVDECRGFEDDVFCDVNCH